MKLEQCVEPMLRMVEFGAPMEVSADFTARLGPGALTGRFAGVDGLQLQTIEQRSGERLRAEWPAPSAVPTSTTTSNDGTFPIRSIQFGWDAVTPSSNSQSEGDLQSWR